MRIRFILFLSLLLGFSAVEAGKPSVPVSLELAVQETTAALLVTVSIHAYSAFTQGEIILHAPAGMERLEGVDRWQGSLSANGFEKWVVRFQRPNQLDRPLIWRATFSGRFSGRVMRSMARVKWQPKAQADKPTISNLPISPKQGVLEFPGG